MKMDFKKVGFKIGFIVLTCLIYIPCFSQTPNLFGFGPQMVCPGVSYSYDVSSSGNIPNRPCLPVTVAHSWAATGGTVISVGPAPGRPASIIWNSVGPNNVQLTTYFTNSVTTGSPPQPCSDLTTINNFTVNMRTSTVSVPTPSISYTGANLCPGDVVPLTASIAPDPKTDFKFYWYYQLTPEGGNPGAFIQIGSSPTISDGNGKSTINFNIPALNQVASNHHSIRFQVIAYFNGCEASGPNSNISLPLFIFPPKPTIAIQGLENKICSKNGKVIVTGNGYFTRYKVHRNGPAGPLQDTIVLGPNFSFPWNNLTEGSYAIQVENYNGVDPGCYGQSFFPIGKFDPVINVTASGVDELCYDLATASGKIKVSLASTPIGAVDVTVPFNYILNTGMATVASGQILSNNSTSFIPNLDGDKTYDLIVTDKNGCQSNPATTSGIAVQEPDEVKVLLNGQVKDVGCKLATQGSISDGQFQLTATGGTSSYVFSDDNGGSYATGNTFPGLVAGTYTSKAKDTNGCESISIPIVVGQPLSAISYSNLATVSPTCNGLATGSITLNGSGGTGTLRYLLNGSVNPSNLFSNLLAGNYTVAVKDANNCVETISNVGITEPTAITFPTLDSTAQSCVANLDGAITVKATGGTGAISYSLTPTAATTSNPDGSITYSNLVKGSYTIDVKDQNNCPVTKNVFVPSKPVISGIFSEPVPISCHGQSDGTLKVVGTGGTPGYTYQWTGGPSSDTYPNRKDGNYSVQITDSKNCKATVSQSIIEPGLLTLSYTKKNYNGFGVSCTGLNDGGIDITVAGGTPNFPPPSYTYVWVNGINGTTVEDQPNLPAGDYSVTASDNHGCQVQSGTISITQPSAVTLSLASKKDISCNGGSDGMISLQASGGTGIGTYQYALNSLAPQLSSIFNTLLMASLYTMQVTDGNGCSTTLSVTLTEPPLLKLDVVSQTSTTCGKANATATVLASGGANGYTYSWYAGTSSIGSGTFIQDLAAGSYKARVVDGNTCQQELNVYINNSNGPSIAVDNVTQTTCHESADGSISISVSQGNPPYAINWPAAGEQTLNVINLKGNTYAVSVTDNIGCLVFKTITVPAPPAITYTEQSQPPTCAGNSDGSISINASGGNGGLNYSWSNGATTGAITSLQAGIYSVRITDAKNCTLDHAVTLLDPVPFKIDLGPDKEMCEGQAVKLGIDLINTTFIWTSKNITLGTDQYITVNKPGVYMAKATNQKGCIAKDSVELILNKDLLKTDFLMIAEAHAGDSIALIDISWPVPTNISWDFGSNAKVIYNSQDWAIIEFDKEGTYTVGLYGQLAGCTGYHAQQITILKKEASPTGGRVDTKPLIHEVLLFPNPTNGKFNISITLREKHDVGVQLISLSNNRVILTEQLSDNDFYERYYELPEYHAGVYFLLIKAGRESKMIRLVIL